MLGVVGLIVPEFFHLPFYPAGATAYENFFKVCDENCSANFRAHALLGLDADSIPTER